MRCLTALAPALILASALTAASVPRMSFEHVVRSSPRAVRGVVVRSWSDWDAGRTSIWTHYDIRVTEALRGPSGSIFTISEPGGAVDGIAMSVPGAPRFDVGEEAVVFAYPTPLGYWRVRGWGQGRFRVEAQNGRQVVRTPQADVLLLDPAKPQAPVAAAVAVGDGEPLEAFLERTRALIREEEGR